MEAEVGTLSFKDVEGLDFESAYAKLKAVIADQCKKLEKLHDDGSVNYGDADIFKRLILKTSGDEEIQNSLKTIMRITFLEVLTDFSR